MFRRNEIVTLSRVWRSPDDNEPWLLTYQLAEIDGRLECVGFEARSYLRVMGKDELGGEYPAYIAGPLAEEEARLADREIVKDQDETADAPRPENDELADAARERERRGLRAPPFGEIGWPKLRPELRGVWASLEEHDQEALGAEYVDAQGERRRGAEEVLTAPRPLLASTIRHLNFASELAHARRETAGSLRRFDSSLKETARDWDAIREEMARDWDEIHGRLARSYGVTREEIADKVHPWGLEYREPPAGARDLFAEGSPESLALAENYVSSRSRAGRSTDMSRLERVARAYTGAYRLGSASPAKDVAEGLDLKPDAARHLIHECRKARLLPPTDERRARGWNPGEAPWERGGP